VVVIQFAGYEATSVNSTLWFHIRSYLVVYNALRLFWFQLPYAQVWDIKTKAHASALTGHVNTLCSVLAWPTVRKHTEI
jgi:hypothetical protein